MLHYAGEIEVAAALVLANLAAGLPWLALHDHSRSPGFEWVGGGVERVLPLHPR